RLLPRRACSLPADHPATTVGAAGAGRAPRRGAGRGAAGGSGAVAGAERRLPGRGARLGPGAAARRHRRPGTHRRGDLVSTLQKTLDVLGQLKDSVRQARRPAGEAAARRPNAQVLLALFDEADRLLRRGVVEASYQWALRGPPEPDAAQTAELGFWPSEQPEEERRPRRPFRRARTPVRRPGRRQPSAAALAD